MKLFIYHLGIFSGSILVTLANNQFAVAQVIPDNTLGIENSTIRQNVDIKGEITDLIEGGAIRDQNLFHSFLEFNIGEGQRVFFANPDSVVNIFSRITGNNSSEIFGTLGVNGNANLFLINPNGILFGENASLDVNGSFLASTAESIIFADGNQFSSTDTQTEPLLTVSIPIGLQMGTTPESIINRSFATDSSGEFVGLQVQPGNTLGLLGGEVSLEGGIITAESGRIEIGSVEGNNLVGITSLEKGWILNYEGVENFQDVNLSNLALIYTSGEIGGDIHIQGQNVIFTGESEINSTTFGSENGGDIVVFASESLELNEGALLSTATEGNGAAGNITISTGGLTLLDGATIASDVCFELGNCAAGTGGNITVMASEFVELNGDAFLSTATEGDGAAGNLTIETNNLFVRNSTLGSFASEEGEGRGGNITVMASEFVEVSGIIETQEEIFPSSISATGETGDGGVVSIDTKKLLVQDGAQITSITFGIGEAGNININASELIEIIGSTPNGFFASALLAQTESDGNAGEINIQTNSLIVRDGAQVSSATFENGQGGTLTINASDSVFLSGAVTNADEFGSSAILVSAELNSTGNAGELTINTGTLTVEDRAKISADTFGVGNGTNVTLNVDRLIIQDGGRVGAGSLLGQGATDNKRGAGGILTVKATESVEISGTGTIGEEPVNSSLFTRAEGTGDAGNLSIDTPTLIVKDSGEITASTLDSGIGGDVEIKAQQLSVSDGGTITATTSGTGAAGNIVLEISEDINLTGNGSGLFASTGSDSTGKGGSISTKNSTPQTITVKDGAAVAVNSDGDGDSGIITLSAAEELTLNNGSITVETSGIGDAGDLSLDTPILTVTNGGSITASTQDAGTGGELEIQAQRLTVSEGGTITALTSGEGDAGNIVLEISDEINLTGDSSGLFASTESGSTGKGGSISTQNQIPQTITVRDGAAIAVNSDGTGEGGSVTLATENLTINKGSITAQTDSSRGGNITLTVGDALRFENSGAITATAGIAEGEGDGGNVTIDADTIFAFPTNNPYQITANAFTGDGGQINIATNNFFGYFDNDNDFVDITASSNLGVDGDVEIDILEVDPARGLTELPSNLVDASRLIDRSCLAGGAEESANEFVITGRGGLPENPREVLKGNAVLSAEWVTLPQGETGVNENQKTVNAANTKKIVEAQGWVVGANGNVVLTARATKTASLAIPWLAPHNCD